MLTSRPIRTRGLPVAWISLALLVAGMLLSGAAAFAVPETYYISRGNNPDKWAFSANFSVSTGHCDFSGISSSTGSMYQASNPTQGTIALTPALANAGGVYDLYVGHVNINVSTNITTSITQSNCSGLPASTTTFRGNGTSNCTGNDWKLIGRFTLSAGHTTPTIVFSNPTGTVDTSTHRWSVEAFKLEYMGISYDLTLTSDPAGGGVLTGGGSYEVGAEVLVTAEANPGYTFTRWTGDGVDTTSPSFVYTMPDGPATLCAHFAPGSYVLSRSACANGSVSGSSGTFVAGTPVTVTAIPAPGYWFDGWTVGSCGGTVVSRLSDYTFPMPGTDYDLRANFVRAELIGTFESYATGGTSFDSLDKNDPVGPNQAANGSGNPWWGPNPPNGRIYNSNSHLGVQSLRGTAGNCRDFYNLAYRHGGGSPFTGGVYLDWWFYDPLGPFGTATTFCADYTALSYYTGLPSDTDYPDPVPNPMTGAVQQLAVGMSDNISAGYDPTKYQVRIVGDPGGYSDGWLNTNVTRSVGWRHARVEVGPRKLPSGTNDVTFYIDDMTSPVLGPRDSVTSVGFNAIEVNTIMPLAGSCASGAGCKYSWPFYFSAVDDIAFGSLTGDPAPLARIADAWSFDDGVPIMLSGKAVTAAFTGGSFWIEEADRTAGMLVTYPGTLGEWQGRSVTVAGTLNSSTVPRNLIATTVQDLGAASPPVAPLGMVLRSLGGSDFNPTTPGAANGTGLYNIGLLASVAGSVSFSDNSDPGNRFFYIDDGSTLAAADGAGHSGIKVKCGATAAPTSGAVRVTGVVSVESSPNGWVPTIITRSGEDITPL